MAENFKWNEQELDKLLEEIQSKKYTLPPLLASMPQNIIPVEDGSCKHKNLPTPEFDAKIAATLSSKEVRKVFPRGNYLCPDCNSHVITYASFEHYISGDW